MIKLKSESFEYRVIGSQIKRSNRFGDFTIGVTALTIEEFLKAIQEGDIRFTKVAITKNNA